LKEIATHSRVPHRGLPLTVPHPTLCGSRHRAANTPWLASHHAAPHTVAYHYTVPHPAPWLTVQHPAPFQAIAAVSDVTTLEKGPAAAEDGFAGSVLLSATFAKSSAEDATMTDAQ
jgi:hypothetical protein